jgi:hypothetical protein
MSSHVLYKKKQNTKKKKQQKTNPLPPKISKIEMHRTYRTKWYPPRGLSDIHPQD